MIKFCSDSPEKCGLEKCLLRGCILNDPMPKTQPVLVAVKESHHDKVYKKMTEGFIPAERYSGQCAPKLTKKVKKRRLGHPKKRLMEPDILNVLSI